MLVGCVSTAMAGNTNTDGRFDHNEVKARAAVTYDSAGKALNARDINSITSVQFSKDGVNYITAGTNYTKYNTDDGGEFRAYNKTKINRADLPTYTEKSINDEKYAAYIIKGTYDDTAKTPFECRIDTKTVYPANTYYNGMNKDRLYKYYGTAIKKDAKKGYDVSGLPVMLVAMILCETSTISYPNGSKSIEMSGLDFAINEQTIESASILGDDQYEVTKVWDTNVSDSMKKEVTVTLYKQRDGAQPEAYKTVVLNETNNWKATIAYNKEAGYTYFVKETAIAGYSSLDDAPFGRSESEKEESTGLVVSETSNVKFDVDDKSVIVVKQGSDKYFVWTKNAVNENMQAVILDNLSNEGLTAKNTSFIYGNDESSIVGQKAVPGQTITDTLSGKTYGFVATKSESADSDEYTNSNTAKNDAESKAKTAAETAAKNEVENNKEDLAAQLLAKVEKAEEETVKQTGATAVKSEVTVSSSVKNTREDDKSCTYYSYFWGTCGEPKDSEIHGTDWWQHQYKGRTYYTYTATAEAKAWVEITYEKQSPATTENVYSSFKLDDAGKTVTLTKDSNTNITAVYTGALATKTKQTITNTFFNKDVTITGSKKFDMSKNQYGIEIPTIKDAEGNVIKPDITLDVKEGSKVLEEGKDYKITWSQLEGSSDTWNFSITGLKEFIDTNNDGIVDTKAIHTVTEAGVVDGHVTLSDGFVYTVTNTENAITNTLDLSQIDHLTAIKNWANIEGSLIPSSVTVELLKNDEPTGKTLVLSANADANKNWRGTFYFAKDDSATFTVREIKIGDQNMVDAAEYTSTVTDNTKLGGIEFDGSLLSHNHLEDGQGSDILTGTTISYRITKFTDSVELAGDKAGIKYMIWTAVELGDSKEDFLTAIKTAANGSIAAGATIDNTYFVSGDDPKTMADFTYEVVTGSHETCYYCGNVHYLPDRYYGHEYTPITVKTTEKRYIKFVNNDNRMWFRYSNMSDFDFLNNGTFTVTNIPEEKSKLVTNTLDNAYTIKGTKTFDITNGGTIPMEGSNPKVTLEVYKDGTQITEGYTVTWTPDDGTTNQWKYTIAGTAITAYKDSNSNGKLDATCSYEVKEANTSIEDRNTVVSIDGQKFAVSYDGYNITNTSFKTLTVEKKWNATNSILDKIFENAASVTVQLTEKRSGETAATPVDGKTLTLNKSNGWTGTITFLPKAGYEYAVVETKVGDETLSDTRYTMSDTEYLTVSYEVDGEKQIVENTINATTSITGTKTFDMQGIDTVKVPVDETTGAPKVDLVVYKNGGADPISDYTLNWVRQKDDSGKDTDAWTYTISGLDKYYDSDSDSLLDDTCSYVVKEIDKDNGFKYEGSDQIVNIDGYDYIVTKDGNNITNTLDKKKLYGDIKITKEIDENVATNGQAIFTFELVHKDTGLKLYKTITIPASSKKESVTISSIPVGDYTITELETLRYNLAAGETNNKSAKVEYNKTPQDVEFKNTLVNKNNFSDTDVVVNQFRKNATTKTITISNTKGLQ